MQKIKAILFDFDGTLADTAPGIVLTMRETFREMGLPIPEEDAMRQTIGIPLFKALKMLNNLSDEVAQEAFLVYNRLFPIYEATHISIFPEVAETLKTFAAQGIRMAICTSRNIESLNIILQHHGMQEYFEMCITVNDNLKPKPAPDMVLALLDRMHISKEEAIVVGDTTYDIEMGNAAGCSTIAVTYGNHSRQQLASAKPTYTIDNFSLLIPILSQQ